jgi:hypothetical protein
VRPRLTRRSAKFALAAFAVLAVLGLLSAAGFIRANAFLLDDPVNQRLVSFLHDRGFVRDGSPPSMSWLDDSRSALLTISWPPEERILWVRLYHRVSPEDLAVYREHARGDQGTGLIEVDGYWIQFSLPSPGTEEMLTTFDPNSGPINERAVRLILRGQAWSGFDWAQRFSVHHPLGVVLTPIELFKSSCAALAVAVVPIGGP